MSETIAIDHLRRWIGKQEEGTDSITPELVRRFNATFAGYAAHDEQHLAASAGIHWCLAPPAASRDALGADGHPATGGFLPPVPLPRRMWASSRIQFHATPVPGQPIVRSSTIADVELKHGAASGPMVLVSVAHSYYQNTVDAQVTLLEEKQTLVYRNAMAYKPPERSSGLRDKKTRVREFVPDSVLLFRYSALTFNGHRIHYDQQYATRDEGYPGLVVQGPLMATLLMQAAQAHRPEQSLSEFTFRGLAPAFADETLQLVILDNNAESLVIENAHGATVMQASARFATRNAGLSDLIRREER